METQIEKVLISDATDAGYELSMPLSWLNAIGVGANDSKIQLRIDGQKIVISRERTMDDFKKYALAEKHILYSIEYYDLSVLCSLIYTDFTTKELMVENYTDDIGKTPFGSNKTPLWKEFLAFLEGRCIPRQRTDLDEYLKTLSMDEYNPFEIVALTSGRLEKDNQWIRMKKLNSII